MATNADAAFGFLPVRMANGSAWNGATMTCLHSGGLAEAFFIGTPVTLAGASEIVEDRGMTLPTIQLATVATTNPILGTIVGFEAKHSDLSAVHAAASIERICYVAVATPDVVFRCQSDATTALVAVGEMGTFTGVSGSTTTGYSDAEYAESTGATTVNQWRVIGYQNTPDNDPETANSILLVVPAHPDIGSSRLVLGV